MTPSLRTRIALLIRFSYPAASGTRSTLGGPEATRRLLYDPDRLVRRFALFEALTLPSLLAQTDADFTTLVLIGDDMPPGPRARLASLLTPLADARLVALPTLPLFAATRRAYDRALVPGLTHLTTVRLDDDDAVSVDLIARIRAAIGPVVALSGGADPAVISFQNGLYVRIGPPANQVFAAIERAPLSVGLTMVTPLPRHDTVFSRNHRHVAQYFSTWSDAVQPSFIRSIHGDNDSNPVQTGQVLTPDDDDLRATLSARFAVTLDTLRSLAP